MQGAGIDEAALSLVGVDLGLGQVTMPGQDVLAGIAECDVSVELCHGCLFSVPSRDIPMLLKYDRKTLVSQ